MSLWRSPKPVIAQVHGWCVGGGSEMALCADIIIASDDARFGTPYSRMWGCHHAGMWVHRLGLAKSAGDRPDPSHVVHAGRASRDRGDQAGH